jgi:hypothetical protein
VEAVAADMLEPNVEPAPPRLVQSRAARAPHLPDSLRANQKRGRARRASLHLVERGQHRCWTRAAQFRWRSLEVAGGLKRERERQSHSSIQTVSGSLPQPVSTNDRTK